jgi:hypothetical protein
MRIKGIPDCKRAHLLLRLDKSPAGKLQNLLIPQFNGDATELIAPSLSM